MSLKLVPCRYYKMGQCRQGSSCQFSHDLNVKGTPPCVYFLRGYCAKGDKCTFRHEKPEKEVRPEKKAPKLPRPTPVIEKPKPVPKNDVLEFIPGASSHALTLAEKLSGLSMEEVSRKRKEKALNEKILELESRLCPYLLDGRCDRQHNGCPFTHGLQCSTCGLHVLIEGHKEQNQRHTMECNAAFEEDMEESFKISEAERIERQRVERSKGKTCGICMEEVLSIENSAERRFAIFQNCIHVFCLKCVRNWRSGRSRIEKDAIRSCPICRTMSHFVIPSQYWIEEAVEKQELIENYKKNLAEKDCRYYNFGDGECPFSISCFYRHQNREGVLQDRTKIDPRITRHHKWDSGAFEELWENLVGEEDYEFANMFIRLSEAYPDFEDDDVRVSLDDIGYSYDDGGYYQNDPSWGHSDDESDGDWDLDTEMP